MRQMLNKLTHLIEEIGPCIVAYSGGVDSTLVALLAREIHGTSAQIVSFVTPLISPYEVRDARILSDALQLDAQFTAFDPRISEKVLENDNLRCYYCKHMLFSALLESCQASIPILDGTNFDDLSDYRPGLKALQELRVRSPLAECGITKQMVREIARELSLPNADKPSAPCLATRFQDGTTLSDERLLRVAKAEEHIRLLGFSDFRVRDHGEYARVEIRNSDDEGARNQISKALSTYYAATEFAER